MNTREKIVEIAALRGTVTIATAYFDPMLDWHAERFAALRGSGALAACILPLDGELLPQRARAELAASLRVIDYVLIAPASDPNAANLLGSLGNSTENNSLNAARVVRLEEEDLRRRAELIAHVRAPQSR
jgi:hypothetical protein